MRKKPKPNKKRSRFNPIKYIINEMDKIFDANRESKTLSEEDFNTYKDMVKKDLVGFATEHQKFEAKKRLKRNMVMTDHNYALREPKQLSLMAKSFMNEAYELNRKENETVS